MEIATVELVRTIREQSALELAAAIERLDLLKEWAGDNPVRRAAVKAYRRDVVHAAAAREAGDYVLALATVISSMASLEDRAPDDWACGLVPLVDVLNPCRSTPISIEAEPRC